MNQNTTLITFNNTISKDNLQLLKNSTGIAFIYNLNNMMLDKIYISNTLNNDVSSEIIKLVTIGCYCWGATIIWVGSYILLQYFIPIIKS